VGLRWQCVVVDCHDARRVAEFWSQVLDLPLQVADDQEWWIEPGGSSPDLLFLEVPEAKTVKNRLHLDLRPEDQTAEVRRLEALGARRVDIGQGEVTWVVMADPEGNEFCVLRALPA
jgi:predicted enzyme related to lactoylglutathione lyase